MNSKVWDKEIFPEVLQNKAIDLNDFSYCLPEERIAQYPVSERDISKLLIAGGSFIEDTVFRNIDEHIPSDHLLIFNNTMVVRARIHFQKDYPAGL